MEQGNTNQSVSLEILVVDDDEAIRSAISDTLGDVGHRVTTAADGAEAQALIDERTFDVVISDLRLPKVDGMALFRRLRTSSPTTAVILMTGYGAVPEAVVSLREGAYDYVTKPLDDEVLCVHVGHIAERVMLQRELERARAELASRDERTVKIVGRTPAIAQVLTLIETYAASDAPVLITGESGTGKELVARAIHARSARTAGPFVAVNCAAFPETLIEAELFGYERGAFTGANRRRDGRFKAAHGGTLLLDEVGEIPLPTQVKLLRALQEGIIDPLGTDRPISVDVRILAATHRNLKELIAAGRFREDLFFRLKVLEMTVPPLRERKGDLVPLLADFFAQRLNGVPHPSIAPRAWAALTEYSYPGNVREFIHALERSLVLSHGGEIDLEHLPTEIAGMATPYAAAPTVRALAIATKEFEREYLIRVLRLCPSKGDAARLLGISRKGLWEKLQRHGISADEIHREARGADP